jgi:hypothetical protein
MGRLGESLPQIGDMARPLGTPGDAMVGLLDVAKWAQGLLSRPLASFVHFLHQFAHILI